MGEYDSCSNSYLICRWSRHDNQIHLCKDIDFNCDIYLITNLPSLSIAYKVNLNLFRLTYKKLHNLAAILTPVSRHIILHSIPLFWSQLIWTLYYQSNLRCTFDCQVFRRFFPTAFTLSLTSSVRLACILQGTAQLSFPSPCLLWSEAGASLSLSLLSFTELRFCHLSHAGSISWFLIKWLDLEKKGPLDYG